MAGQEWKVDIGPRLERQFRLAWLSLKRRGQTTRIIREDDERGVYEDDQVLPFRPLKDAVAAAMEAIGTRHGWKVDRRNRAEVLNDINKALQANPLEVFDERPQRER